MGASTARFLGKPKPSCGFSEDLLDPFSGVPSFMTQALDHFRKHRLVPQNRLVELLISSCESGRESQSFADDHDDRSKHRQS